MERKRILTEKISEREKELLEIFRTLKSNKYQERFMGQAEVIIKRLKESEATKETIKKTHLKIIK